MVVRVDGTEVARRVVDPNGGTCGDVEPENGDPYEFAAPQPCPLDADGEVSFDTRSLRDGNHTLELTVEDAAGNVSAVHAEQFETHNAPVATAVPALGGAGRVGTGALTATNGQWDGAPTTFDHRWLRCDANGMNCAPIAGASGAQYVPTEADAYRRLVVEVVAANASGWATAQSAPSGTVADAAGHTSPPERRAPIQRDDERDPDDPAPTSKPETPLRTPPVDDGGVGGLQNPVAEQGGRSPNGTNASSAAKFTLTLGFPGSNGGLRRAAASARQRVRLVGRLTDEHGRPIAGARVNLAVKVAGRRWAARGTLRTDADGLARRRITATSSRSIRLTYFPFASSRSFRASNTVVLDVAAPLALTVDRTRVGGARIVTLRGRAGGGSIPAGGLLVTLQGHQRGWGWRTFRTVRTARDGSFRTRYRFRSTSGRFGFRAVVPSQGRYPFKTSTSRPVFVTVS